ncbi:MAG TPA: TonB-dependent receptor plug domain-containing protein [Oligoflexus sp.]|uniref:TonB-dependent receptor n=1 Tax=Oligoflexus sp. TaxID=1971216 RepID=UPI002D808418|nr:TonB-dependent receptor plug domain-containing protein [Oligoflexus sp.]HET9236517.1 TonB-dependent receptor plug domain-containing protein [Oligoflexus sp.]
MRKNIHQWCPLLLVLMASQALWAADENELSLSDLLNLKVSVATRKDMHIRETPGIVTVITREQMLDMGARDVVDVLLRMVPGYGVVTEIEGGQLLSIRGINSVEGKFLVMVDGLDINEEKFGITQFARHFPVNTLDRIEIVRGPGSSVYGGYAALGVINILTRSASRPGSYVNMDIEQGGRAFLNRTLAAGVAKDEGDLAYSANVVASRSLITDQKATTYYGDEIDLKDSQLELANMTLNVKYKGTYAKALVDLYRAPFLYFDEPDIAPWQHIRERWDTYQVETGHEWTSGALKITPFINYKLQYPYWVDQGPYWYRNKVDRKTGGVTLHYDWTDKTNMIVGYQGFIHTTYRSPKLNLAANEEILKKNEEIDHISYRNDSLFLQLMNDNDWVKLTAGVRYDKTDLHGDFFAPRVGFTRAWQDFHAKYMLSQSFRVPGGIIPNRVEDSNNYGIKPETTRNHELEVGYRFSDTLWGVVSVFDHLVHRPIVYFTGPSGAGIYGNGGDLGSRGFESELRFQSSQVFATFTYAYYQLTLNDEPSAQVPGHDQAAYGQAQHKAGLVTGYKVNREFSVNPSLSLVGERFAFTEQGPEVGTDASGDPIRDPAPLQKLPLTTLLNVNLRHSNLFQTQGLEASFAVQNLTDARLEIAQPYQAKYPVGPIPFPGRSYMLRTQYEF